MEIITNKEIKFNSLEKKIFKEMMELGRNILIDQLRLIDGLILKFRDKSIFKPKDLVKTTIKTILGDVEFYRRRYSYKLDGKKKYIFLLDEFLEMYSVGKYSEAFVEKVVREVTKKSYRESAKTLSEDTDSFISHNAIRNIIIELGEKIKALEQEKITLYQAGKIEGQKEIDYVFCEHDGIYIKKQKSKKSKNKKNIKRIKSKKSKKKKNGIELKIAVIHEGKIKRYENDYKLKNKIIVGTAQTSNELKKIEDMTLGIKYKENKINKIIINGDGSDWTASIVNGEKEIFQLDMAHVQKKIYMAVSDEEYLRQMKDIMYSSNAEEILNIIFNYKVELEEDKKESELKKVIELEEYLKNNINGLTRYQYKLGLTERELEESKEILPNLGTEESQMYSVCRARMKKNRTSWAKYSAEALLKVIMNSMNNTIQDILSQKAKKDLIEELNERIPEPKKIRKKNYDDRKNIETRRIMDNIIRKYTKENIKKLLRPEDFSELKIIN